MAPLKKTILKRVWNEASALESHGVTQISQKTILEVAEAVAVTEGEGVQVDWIHREINKILKAKDHHSLTQNADQIRERIAAVQRQLDEMVDELEQLEAEMSGQGIGAASSGEYIVVARMLLLL